jgi:tetratricopeptide (TPR) repeat protein
VEPTDPRPRFWLPALLLAAAVVLAYQPAWQAGFVWDDDVYVTNNRLLAAPDGLQRIWFSTDSPSQYFPLTYTALRMERHAWELAASGYHWVNILLHAANALILWGVLRRLRLPAPWLAAALFALHPVQVESVAWITELKNVLSLFFCLLAAWAWIEFVSERPRAWRFYAAALLFQALALFAKTTACMWPAAMLLILWLQRKPIGLRRLLQIAPFVAMGLAMGLVCVWWEQHRQYTVGDVFAIGWTSRLLIASRAVWFYLGKLLWPVGLSFSYARWQMDPASPSQYLWPAACVIAAVAASRNGRGLIAAGLFFLAMLAPLLGFISEYTFRYSYVADHYQYIASIGPLALAAALIDKISGRLKPWICPGLLILLGVLTWRQCRNYSDSESLWRATLAATPNSSIARNNLSQAILAKGSFDEPIALSNEVLAKNPNDPVALNNLGFALLARGRTPEAVALFQRAIAAQPNAPAAYYNLGRACLDQKRYDEATAHFQTAIRLKPDYAAARCNLAFALLQTGHVAAAVSNYEASLTLDPDYCVAHNDLGTVLLKLGRTNEALLHFERAVSIKSDFVEARYNLAGILLDAGQLDEALNQYEQIARLRPAMASSHFMLGRLADAYVRAGRPDRAAAVLTRALELARAAGETSLANNLAAHLQTLQSARHQ